MCPLPNTSVHHKWKELCFGVVQFFPPYVIVDEKCISDQATVIYFNTYKTSVKVHPPWVFRSCNKEISKVQRSIK